MLSAVHGVTLGTVSMVCGLGGGAHQVGCLLDAPDTTVMVSLEPAVCIRDAR